MVAFQPRRVLLFFLATLLPAPGALAAEAPIQLIQRRIEGGMSLTWPGAVKAADGTMQRPWFELQASTNLVTWTPLDQRRRAAAAGDLLQVTVAAGDRLGFYRVLAHVAPPMAALGSGGEEVFGFGEAFDRALAEIGQISVEEFRRRYDSGAVYLEQFPWDPTTATFWNEFNANPAVVNVGKVPGDPGYRLSDYRLTAEELAILKKLGFVVRPARESSFGRWFYDLWHNDLPVFISTDAMLHAWHRSYVMMLAELEETLLIDGTRKLLDGMALRVPAAAAAVGEGALRDSVRDADFFVAVARSLIFGEQVPSMLGQDAKVARTLQNVQSERMIQETELFGQCRTVDYSQFAPRGHYADSLHLSQYFRSMMWLGRIDLPVAGGPFARCLGEMRMASPRELGTAVVLHHLIQDSGGAEQWRQVDLLLRTWVGWSDNLNLDQLSGVLAGAGVESLSDINTLDRLEGIQSALQSGDLGTQNIRSDVFFSPLSDEPAQLPRSFAVFGQRFVPDSWTMSKVVYDSVFWREGELSVPVPRRVPSALDVAFATLGNDQAAPLIAERILRKGGTSHVGRFRDGHFFQHNLAAARTVIDAQRPEAWRSSIALGWLGALRSLSPPTTGIEFPAVMRTRAWAMRTLNTQLASWAQYRHDTLLYAKPSYTGIPMCFYPAGFVEPRPAFWRALAELASNSANLLRSLKYPESFQRDTNLSGWALRNNQVAHLERFAWHAAQLAVMADKELEQQPFSEAEELLVRNLMQASGTDLFGCAFSPRYSGWYPQMFYRSLVRPWGPSLPDAEFHELLGCTRVDSVVADVHTDPPSPGTGDPGGVLHQGVDDVALMVLAVDNGPDRVIYAGPVLLHREFEIIGEPKRLTDEHWRRRSFPGPVEGLGPTEWTREFISPGSR